MRKILILVWLAIASFLIAGSRLEPHLSWGWVIPFVVGVSLLCWAVFALLDWYSELNAESSILYVLDTRRGYEVVGKKNIAGQPVQILIELDTKKKRIALIELGLNSGFIEVKMDRKTFWVPPGKYIARGKSDDYIFVVD
ncbi:MAG: hypothetical protein M0P64_02805 [Candidatus Pacebacteria bacterium]|jgi:hypothetical protein|nr:hypothetical protein [Candidatus Paceibacterota bacterium]